MKTLLTNFKSRADIQQLIAAVERSRKQAVEELREDTAELGYRVEKGQEEILQVIADVQDTTKYHEEILNTYMNQLDDFENRDRRQNIRI